jgi:hypothetical protein
MTPAITAIITTATPVAAAMTITLALPVATMVLVATAPPTAPTTIAWHMLMAPLDWTVPPVSHFTLCFISGGMVIMYLALFSSTILSIAS